MAGERILVVDDSAESRAWLIESVARLAAYVVAEAASPDEARAKVVAFQPDVVVLDAQLGPVNGLDLLGEWESTFPVVVTTTRRSLDEVNAALEAGARDVLIKPFEAARLARSIERALNAPGLARDRDRQRERAERQAQEFNALYSIGKTITSLLHIEEILSQVVTSAVNLTRADEGSLFLLDTNTGELYLRAQKNLDTATVASNLRVRVEDSLLGRVIQTGRAVMLGSDDLLRVKTSFLVRAILIVPLTVGGRTLGVLSVDDKRTTHAFTEHDVHLLTTLADYAVIALENARLYWAVSDERIQLHTILRDTQDAVIVVDLGQRILLVNQAARTAFNLRNGAVGRLLAEVIDNSALIDLFDPRKSHGHAWRAEIPLPGGQVLQGQLSELSGVGFSAVMRDISRLKELDHLKSEFISTVSHDLRTPLTTIRGYIELLPRVGPLTDMQQDFVERVERSVLTIADLISDLLDVSRIEAGLDWEMETVNLKEIVQDAVDLLQEEAASKQHRLTTELPEASTIRGNGRRLEQVVTNLVGNAIKYTPPGGQIDVLLRDNKDYALLEVRDTGIGISSEDQRHIFDKFYRVESDATLSIVGTGLGLSIVKSIVDKHQGRVWVESEVGVGSTFSLLLPRSLEP